MSYDSNTKSWSVVSGGSASTPAATAAQTESNAAQPATTAAGTSAGATAATTTSTAAPPTAAEKKLEKVNLAKKIQKVRLQLHEYFRCSFIRISELPYVLL